ncbi:MAG: hypothetical protein ACTSR3_01015 [Candidatus Helarchaeota archaeon]
MTERKEGIEKNGFREAIIRVIKNKQGITYKKLLDKMLEEESKEREDYPLGFPISNTQYHLLILESQRIIVSIKYGKYRHYFTEDYPEKKRWFEIFSQYRLPSMIIDFLSDNFSANNKTLCKICDAKQENISYHTTRMVKHGVLNVEKQGRFRLFSLNKLEDE